MEAYYNVLARRDGVGTGRLNGKAYVSRSHTK